jgi:3-oxoacyl-[acyl-carrier protein] reductase
VQPGKAGALNQFSDRVALVSNGSRGIGAAIVLMLAGSGWDVTFCHDRDDLAAVEVEKGACELGVRVLAVQADVTRPAEAAAWVQRAAGELGPVQAAVACAGITRDRPLAQLADADWRALTDTGLDGVRQLCRAVLPAMVARQGGRIIAVSSVSAAYGDRDIPGVAAFTRALAGQTRRYGIRANAITPAPCGASSRADTVSVWPAEPAPPSAPRARLAEAVAVRRFGSALAVAAQVAFLLSEAAAELTGTLLELPADL